MTDQLTIHSKLRDYPILFTEDIFQPLQELVATKKEPKILFLTDQNVYDLYQPLFEKLQESFKACLHISPAGGQSKSLEETSRIYNKLLDENFTRKDMIVTIGGGVIGDLGGFVAATFYRGISYVQIPTTLLSQVDSSIGGKVGIHFNDFTNMIGSIYPPELIIVSTNFLLTLPEREFSCGISEMLKIAFIHDKPYFKEIVAYQKNPDQSLLKPLIYQAINHKKKIVEEDEFENGKRLSLNFGHTIGHAIEALCHHDAYHHGEAIAVGMIFEAKLALAHGEIKQEDLDQLTQAFQAFQLPTALNKFQPKAEELFDVLKTDKKNSKDTIVFILPNQNGFLPLAISKENQAFVETIRQLLQLH
ncbi:3-dehydroquinate synthase [Streptococcus ictaluri]|uniref:3-dehydroquinate synthase n=1 Tax=Streptococcus ictaluri 707-05 TaxID=764299 RepID=G5K150_9STRE|nr:3-dehydroquinate synthase [Streptococcus ictaluri]EHI70432.1 3-dehydroquinate synthase [Streptococcus ictaluri 707-05]